MDVRSNSIQQGGKKFSFSCSCLLSPWQQFLNQNNFPCIDFSLYFQTASIFCTFWDIAFHCWPCSHGLSSQLLMATSSSSLQPQQPHCVHLPSTMMSGQISGISRLAKGRTKQPSPFFTWSTYFHSGSPSTLIFALLIYFSLIFRSELFMAHSPESDMHMEVKLHQITGYISLSSFTLSLNQLLQSIHQNMMDQQVWPYCFSGWLSLLYSSPHLGQDAAPLWGFCCLSERPRQAQFCFKELLQSTQKMGNVMETFWKYTHPSRRNFIIIPPSPFFLNLWDAWDARHWYWRTHNH